MKWTQERALEGLQQRIDKIVENYLREKEYKLKRYKKHE